MSSNAAISSAAWLPCARRAAWARRSSSSGCSLFSHAAPRRSEFPSFDFSVVSWSGRPGLVLGHALDGDIVGLAGTQDGHLRHLDDPARHRQFRRAHLLGISDKAAWLGVTLVGDKDQ